MLTPGVRRHWNESWYPVLNGSGEIAGFGVVVEEITQRKVAEDQLRRQAFMAAQDDDGSTKR